LWLWEFISQQRSRGKIGQRPGKGKDREMESNKQIVKDFVELVWNQRNLGLADSIFATDCHTHQLRSGAPVN
jgi:hypothetical protein